MNNPKQLTAPMFGVDDLKDPKLAERLIERIKASLSGFIPEDYWEPMIAQAMSDLYNFKLVVQPSSYSKNKGIPVRDADHERQVIEITELATYLQYETTQVYGTRLQTFKVEQRDGNGDRVRKPGSTYEYLMEEVEDEVELRIVERVPSKFYAIVRNEAEKQAEVLLRNKVGEYFTREASVGGPSAHPSELLQDELRKAMPEILMSVMSSLLSRQFMEFQVFLNQRMR